MCKRHSVEIRAEGQAAAKIDPRNIRDGIVFTLDAENIPFGCGVSVLITSDGEIRKINNSLRNIDASTDVLSFPMHDFTPGAFKKPPKSELDPANGRIPLGDIVISAETAMRQADEFGSNISRETAYLTVHSVLHLLGYDHLDEAENKKLMRSREKLIMKNLGYSED